MSELQVCREINEDLDADQIAELAKLRAALREHMAVVKPKRFAHSLSVAAEAARLAHIYSVSSYLAQAAGILHDWDKTLTFDEQLQHAQAANIDMGVELSLVGNLLHGLTAAHDLPSKFPELPSEVWQAIARHTTGAQDMTSLDMVLFIADGIEPLRPASPGIERTRSLVGKVSLEELYWESFIGGVVYVLEGRRYLYPGTLELYNSYVLKH